MSDKSEIQYSLTDWPFTSFDCFNNKQRSSQLTVSWHQTRCFIDALFKDTADSVIQENIEDVPMAAAAVLAVADGDAAPVDLAVDTDVASVGFVVDRDRKTAGLADSWVDSLADNWADDTAALAGHFLNEHMMSVAVLSALGCCIQDLEVWNGLYWEHRSFAEEDNALEGHTDCSKPNAVKTEAAAEADVFVKMAGSRD